MKSDINQLFLIQLKTDCFILFTAEAFKHILQLGAKGKKRNKTKKKNQKK